MITYRSENFTLVFWEWIWEWPPLSKPLLQFRKRLLFWVRVWITEIRNEKICSFHLQRPGNTYNYQRHLNIRYSWNEIDSEFEFEKIWSFHLWHPGNTYNYQRYEQLEWRHIKFTEIRNEKIVWFFRLQPGNIVSYNYQCYLSIRYNWNDNEFLFQLPKWETKS